MKNILTALIIISLVIISDAALSNSPEDPVKGMMEAIIADDYEKALTFIDVKGILKLMKEQMAEIKKSLPEEEREAFEKEFKALKPEDIKKDFMDRAKKRSEETDFSYRILKVKDMKEDTATVVLEITTNGRTDKDEITVIKIDGVWKTGIVREQMPKIKPVQEKMEPVSERQE